ncbi:MAG: DUF4432 family protein [Chloroflexota bacterium]|nr:MAG: DUF4432 family protein [Chloroflexota bacterium]
MAYLYGRNWTRRDLLRRIGDIGQLGGARPIRLESGPEDGVSAVQFRTGGGLSFTVLPGRGMDIGLADFRGAPLNWMSATGEQHAAFYEPSWLRGFYGGLMVTCGLSTAGWAGPDEGQELPLHGRASYLPARNVQVDGEWQGDDYVMWARGRVRETVPYGENIQLTRKVWARLGENRLFIEDLVENLGHDSVPHMIAYHINPGFPVLDGGSELLFSPREVTPINDGSSGGLAAHARFDGPIDGWQAQVFHHRPRPDSDGLAHTALVNRRVGLGLYVRQRPSELGWMWQWKQTGPGLYVVGMEPANCQGLGRGHERAHGALRFLAPGASQEYHLEIGVLDGADAIAEFERHTG